MSWKNVSIRKELKEEIEEAIKETSYGNLARFVDLALRNELEKLRKEKMDKIFIKNNGEAKVKE